MDEYNHNKVIQSVESMFRICWAHHFPSIHSEMLKRTIYSISTEWLYVFEVGPRVQCQHSQWHRESVTYRRQSWNKEKSSNRISKRLKFVGEHYASIILIHTHHSSDKRENSLKMRSNSIPSKCIDISYFFRACFAFARLIHALKAPRWLPFKWNILH